MKIFNIKKSVLEAALERINYLFDEFPNVVVGFSGGKDSTVTLNLALQVARERGRLPLKVMWIDQEAEWQGTRDYCERIFTMEDIEPYWFQMQMVITNNASSFNRYNYCWNPEDKEDWIHPQHPISIKTNKYGTDRFHDLFQRIFRVEFDGVKSCYLAGVRAEEAPKRHVALTQSATYKDITWGTVLDKRRQHYTFYPLYDWSYTDIWKYINENGVDYNKVYDGMYRHGVQLNEMRISNLHHETAIQNLLMVQEIEPQTWNKIANRIDGASSIKHIKRNSFTCPAELPFMFENWKEYALYLAENIIQDKKNYELLMRRLQSKSSKTSEIFYESFNDVLYKQFWKTVINTILSSDWDFTKMANFAMKPDMVSPRLYYDKKWNLLNLNLCMKSKYFTDEQKKEIWTRLKK